jgi:hypothetical protein
MSGLKKKKKKKIYDKMKVSENNFSNFAFK